MAVDGDAGLQPAFETITAAINTVLERTSEEFRSAVLEMEILVSAIMTAKRECKLAHLLLLAEKYRPMEDMLDNALTNVAQAVLSMISVIDALAAVDRDTLGGRVAPSY